MVEKMKIHEFQYRKPLLHITNIEKGES